MENFIEIYKDQLGFAILMWYCILRLYPLRHMTIMSNIESYGLGVGLATLAYKIASLAIIAYFLISFFKGIFLAPFMIILISGISSAILGRLLVVLHIIRASTIEAPRFMMTLYGIGLIFSEIKLLTAIVYK